MYSSAQCEGWDAFAVIEEFMHFDESYSEGVDPRLVRYDKYWGPNFFVEIDGKRKKRNYFLSELEPSARYALPLIKNIKHWM